MKTKQFDGALNLYLSACKADPTNHAAFVGVADVQSRQGLPGSALPFLQQAVKIKPDDEASWLKVGITTERLDEAMRVEGGSIPDLMMEAFLNAVRVTSEKLEDIDISDKQSKRLLKIKSMALKKLPMLAFQRVASPQDQYDIFTAELEMASGLVDDRDPISECRAHMKLAGLNHHWRGDSSSAQQNLGAIEKLAKTYHACGQFEDKLFASRVKIATGKTREEKEKGVTEMRKYVEETKGKTHGMEQLRSR
jgi:tetratricopeptide (TPR) repeat protein